jgi:5-methylcytosine-specific restriction endonuclease McrA
VDHIHPRSLGGSDNPSNLALACDKCDRAKSDKRAGIDPMTQDEVPLFNPRTQSWEEHFRWLDDCQILEGITPTGRATVETLDMNNQKLCVEARKLWFAAGLLPWKQEPDP